MMAMRRCTLAAAVAAAACWPAGAWHDTPQLTPRRSARAVLRASPTPPMDAAALPLAPELASFFDTVEAALVDGTLLKLTLSKNAAQQQAAAADDDDDNSRRDGTGGNLPTLFRLKNVYGRGVELKRGRCLQLTYRYEHRDEVYNYAADGDGGGGGNGEAAGASELHGALRDLVRSDHFRNARLFVASGADTEVKLKASGKTKLTQHKPKAGGVAAGAGAAVGEGGAYASHDRRKKVPLQTDAAFLRALGVTNEEGAPRPGMANKLRQIQRYVKEGARAAASPPCDRQAVPTLGGHRITPHQSQHHPHPPTTSPPRYVEILSKIVDRSYSAHGRGVGGSGSRGGEDGSEGSEADGGDDGDAGAGGGDDVEDRPPLRIVDVGCGRGYLTFAAHAHFHTRSSGGGGKIGGDSDGGESGSGVDAASARYGQVRTVGVEVRPDLVRETNAIAEGLGAGFEGLGFVESPISDYLDLGATDATDATDATSTSDASGAEAGGSTGSVGGVDVLIALHACDTATDDALWCGMRNGARVIVTAPCCHKEVRRQLEGAHGGGGGELGTEHPLAEVLGYGIFRERTAEMVTDTIRSILLEIADYDVSVLEFIGLEGTAKNIMVAATKRPPHRARSEAEKDALRGRLHALMALVGARRQKLAEWMGEVEPSLDAHGRAREGAAVRGGPSRMPV